MNFITMFKARYALSFLLIILFLTPISEVGAATTSKSETKSEGFWQRNIINPLSYLFQPLYPVESQTPPKPKKLVNITKKPSATAGVVAGVATSSINTDSSQSAVVVTGTGPSDVTKDEILGWIKDALAGQSTTEYQSQPPIVQNIYQRSGSSDGLANSIGASIKSLKSDIDTVSSSLSGGGYMTSYDAFSHPSYGGSATSSLLTLTGGFLSQASSTQVGDLLIAGGTLNVKGSSGQVANLLNIASSTGNSVFAVGSDGNVSITPGTNSATAFVINNSSNSAVFTIDNTTPTAIDNLLTVASTTGTDLFTISGFGDAFVYRRLGIASSSPSARLAVQGMQSNPSLDLVQVATSTGSVLVVVDANGKMGIGTTTPWKTLSVTGHVAMNALANDSTGYYVCLNTTSGNLATSTTACGASSQKFKENIEDLSYGLDEVLSLRPVSFDYKETYLKNARRQVGFIAEEVASITPEVVAYDDNGEIQGLDYPKFTSIIVKAIQDLNTRIGGAAGSISSSVNNIIDSITVRKAKVTQGFEMTDQVTGNTYCVTLKSGDIVKEQGNCPDLNGSSSNTITTVVTPTTNTTTSSSTSTSTPSDTSTTTSVTSNVSSTTPAITTPASTATSTGSASSTGSGQAATTTSQQ